MNLQMDFRDCQWFSLLYTLGLVFLITSFNQKLHGYRLAKHKPSLNILLKNNLKDLWILKLILLVVKHMDCVDNNSVKILFLMMMALLKHLDSDSNTSP